MQTNEIVPNAFLDNLGTDWIAVAANGVIVGRATTREAAERSSPKAVAYYCQKDLDAGSKHAGKAALADPVGLNEASMLAAFEEAAKTGPISINPTVVVRDDDRTGFVPPDVGGETTNEFSADDMSAKEELPPDSELKKPIIGAEMFDHDGDGHVGGRKRKPKS